MIRGVEKANTYDIPRGKALPKTTSTMSSSRSIKHDDIRNNREQREKVEIAFAMYVGTKRTLLVRLGHTTQKNLCRPFRLPSKGGANFSKAKKKCGERRSKIEKQGELGALASCPALVPAKRPCPAILSDSNFKAFSEQRKQLCHFGYTSLLKPDFEPQLPEYDFARI
ncbi:hypothetical protein BDD12DRAFT_104617 [Trichophaea hybrida]|nr:hypothetical protein BDD12DRAFT_104617 [Trichophaea hybrida]